MQWIKPTQKVRFGLFLILIILSNLALMSCNLSLQDYSNRNFPWKFQQIVNKQSSNINAYIAKNDGLSHNIVVPSTLNSSITNSTFQCIAPRFGYTVVGLKMNGSQSLAASLSLSTNSTSFVSPYLINETSASNQSLISWVGIEGRSLDEKLIYSVFLNRTDGEGVCWLEMENYTKSIVQNQPLSSGLGLFTQQEIIDVYDFYVDPNFHYNISFVPDEYALTLDLDLYITKGNSSSDKPLYLGNSGGINEAEELNSLEFNETGYYAIILVRKSGSGYYNYQINSYFIIEEKTAYSLIDGISYNGSLDALSGARDAYFIVQVNHYDYSTIVAYSEDLDLKLRIYLDPNLSTLYQESAVSGLGEIEGIVINGRDLTLQGKDFLYIELSTTWATEQGEFRLEYHESYDIIAEGTELNFVLTSANRVNLIEWKTTSYFDYDSYLSCGDLTGINFYLFDSTSNITHPTQMGTKVDVLNTAYITGIDKEPVGNYLSILVIANGVPKNVTLRITPHDLNSPQLMGVQTNPDPITYDEPGQVQVYMNDSNGLGTASVNMSYRLFGEQEWNTAPMTRSETDPTCFIGSLNITTQYGDFILIYFEFSDFAGNSGTAYKTGNPYMVEVDDSTAPTIQNITISPEIPTPDDTVTISAIIEEPTAAAGFGNASLFYSTDFGTTWIEVEMQWDEITYNATCTIPQMDKNTEVLFYITAYDKAGNQALADNNGGMYGYNVEKEAFFEDDETLLIIGGLIGLAAVVTIGGIYANRLLRKRRMGSEQ
ncbi:MAG: hypothetical protein ACFFDT_14115 [Candidatus Hodarchaeota archaeon]